MSIEEDNRTMKTFRGFKESSTCKARVCINGQEKDVWLLFEAGYNWEEIGDKVILKENGPEGWTSQEYPTDDVEVIKILPWEKPSGWKEAGFGEIPCASRID